MRASADIDRSSNRTRNFFFKCSAHMHIYIACMMLQTSGRVWGLFAHSRHMSKNDEILLTKKSNLACV